MPRLVISKAALFHKEYVFSGMDIITLGRARSNDIPLPDPARKVSRYHAAIVQHQRVPERYFVRDLSSLRGTKVGGELVFQRMLRDGDVVQIADYELTYFEHAPEKQRWSRLHVAPGKAESSAVDRSTILFTHQALLAEVSLSAERREVLEELLRRAERKDSLGGLLERMIGAAARVIGADRGFASLYLPDGLLEECGVTGLRPEEQIEISDLSFLDRVREGRSVQDETTLLAPILLGEEVLGFFCMDRLAPKEPFSVEEASFLLTFGKLAAGHCRAHAMGAAPPAAEELPVEWRMEMVSKSKRMAPVLQQTRQAAASELNVLVRGETGTGKELVARAIHYESARARGPFLAANCATITESLAEMEILGYAPNCGIFGARKEGSPGWFELADGGTLFLDEVQALTPALQDKFLRVLEYKEVKRLGADRPVQVRVKVVAATDKNLEDAVERGEFRKPLYYRFGQQILLPPLRDRREDIPLLAHFFLDRYAARQGSQPRAFSHRALQLLMNYSWPGNVRVLADCVRKAVENNKEKGALLSWDFPLPDAPTAPEAEVAEVAQASGDARPPAPREAGPRTMQEREKEAVMEALESAKGNITKATKLLGYKSRMTMLSKMDKFGIPRDYGDPEAAT